MGTKNKVGRPPVDSDLVRTRLRREAIEAVDAFAADQPDNPGRPEALRRIIQDWLIGHSYLKSSD